MSLVTLGNPAESWLLYMSNFRGELSIYVVFHYPLVPGWISPGGWIHSQGARPAPKEIDDSHARAKLRAQGVRARTRPNSNPSIFRQ
jgi:hypothetical protein